MSFHFGIIGATGAIGKELLILLDELNITLESLKLFASQSSQGKKINFRGEEIPLLPLNKRAFEGLDIAFFCAGSAISKEFAKAATESNTVVIDNSSAFRLDPQVPLVIPEINPEALQNHQGIIANPNCSTIIALMALAPLHKEFGLQRFFASTYQAVSGAGNKAIGELQSQLKSWSSNENISKPEVFPHQIALNLFPHVGDFGPDGHSSEELKMLNESRKILNLPNLSVSTTCVRVPVLRAHSIAITAQFEKLPSIDRAYAALKNTPGIEVIDNPTKNHYPIPQTASKNINCQVGRLRKDAALENGLSLWVSGDQLWKGGALNAIQIAQEILKK